MAAIWRLLIVLAAYISLAGAETTDCKWHPCGSGCADSNCATGKACMEGINSCPANETCYPQAVCLPTTCPAIFDRPDYGCTNEPSASSCKGDADCGEGQYCCYNGPKCKSTCLTKVLNEYPTTDFVITLKITDKISENNLKNVLILEGWNKMEEIFDGIEYFAGVARVNFSPQSSDGLSNMTVTIAFTGNRSADDVFIVDGLAAWFHQRMVDDQIFHFSDEHIYKIVANKLSTKIFFNIKFWLDGNLEEIPYLGPCEFIKIRKTCKQGVCTSSFIRSRGFTVKCDCGRYLGSKCVIDPEKVIKIQLILDINFNPKFLSTETGYFKRLRSALITQLTAILKDTPGFVSVNITGFLKHAGSRTAVEVYINLSDNVKTSRRMFVISGLTWKLGQSFITRHSLSLGPFFGDVPLMKFPGSASYLSLSFFDVKKQAMTESKIVTDVCGVFNTLNLCQNSNCIDRRGQPYCDCDPDYEGDFCTEQVTKRNRIQTSFVIDYEWNPDYSNLDLNITKTLLGNINLSKLFGFDMITSYHIVRFEEASDKKLKVIVELRFRSQHSQIDYYYFSSSITTTLIKRFSSVRIAIGSDYVSFVVIREGMFFELNFVNENGDFMEAVLVPQDVCFIYTKYKICQNNGVCVPLNSEPTCSCPDSYEGEFCQRSRLSFDKIVMNFCLDVEWSASYNDSKSLLYRNLVDDVIMPTLNALIVKFNSESGIHVNMSHFSLERDQNNKVCSWFSLSMPMQPDVISYSELYSNVTDYLTLRITKKMAAYSLINFGSDQKPVYLTSKIFNTKTSTYDTVLLANGCDIFDFFDYCGDNGKCYMKEMMSKCRCTPFTTGKRCETYITPQRECHVDKPLMVGDFYRICNKNDNTTCPKDYTCQSGYSTPSLNVCCRTMDRGPEVVVFNFTLGIAWLEAFNDLKTDEAKQFAREIEKSLSELFRLKQEYVEAKVTAFRRDGSSVRVIVNITYITNDPDNKLLIITEFASIWQRAVMKLDGKLTVGNQGDITLVALYDNTYLTVSTSTAQQTVVFEEACLFLSAIYPCQNGGTCQNKNDRVSCSCPEGYTGYFCNEYKPVKEVCVSSINQCVNKIDVNIDVNSIDYLCELDNCFTKFHDACHTERQYGIMALTNFLTKACQRRDKDTCLKDALFCVSKNFRHSFFDVMDMCGSDSNATVTCLKSVNQSKCQNDKVDDVYYTDSLSIWYRYQCDQTCTTDSCQEMLQNVDPQEKTVCPLLKKYTGCLVTRLSTCGPQSWTNLTEAVTNIKSIINDRCTNVSLPDDIYDECGFGCFLVFLSDISQSLHSGYPHYCGSWQLFDSCVTRSKRQCTNNAAIQKILTDAQTSFAARYNSACLTKQCNITVGLQCTGDLKLRTQSAIGWEQSEWWKNRCTLTRWIKPKLQPTHDSDQVDDDKCSLYNPVRDQCLLCSEEDDNKPPSRVEQNPGENTCAAEFSWGVLCKDLQMSKTCVSNTTISCQSAVGNEIAGSWHSVAMSHGLDKVCIGVACDKEAAIRCVSNLTKIAFKKALGVIGWMRYCQDDVDLMKCLIGSVVECTPHINKLLVPYVQALLYDLKLSKCEQNGDVVPPSCQGEADEIVSVISNFSILLLEKNLEVNLNTTSLCQNWTTLRLKLNVFLNNNTITCAPFKAVIGRLLRRLNQIFDDLCTPAECQVTRAYKCINELAFWNDNHRLPKWSILKSAWNQSEWSAAEDMHKSGMSDDDDDSWWEWDSSSQDQSQSADKPDDSNDDDDDDDDDRYCWMIAEVRKCISWHSVKCSDEIIGYINITFNNTLKMSNKTCESACSKYPCQHGGTCNDEDDGFYTCDCPTGYTGDNCETALCKEYEAEQCIYSYMSAVFRPVFETITDFSWFKGSEGICRLTNETIQCVRGSTEYCPGDIKDRYVSFINVTLSRVALTCDNHQPCDLADFLNLASCFVPRLTGLDKLGLITNTKNITELDSKLFCRAWSEVGECLVEKDVCDFFDAFYLAIGNYLCPSPKCSLRSILHCQSGIRELRQKHPNGVPVCGCQEEEDFCKDYAYYETCIARSEASCSSWWNEWSKQVNTTITTNITYIEKCYDPCVGNLCENGATCVPDNDDGYKCQCPTGYTGQYCENDICVEHQAMTCFSEFWLHAFDVEGQNFLLSGLCGNAIVKVKGCISKSIEFCPNSVKFKFEALLATTIRQIEDACKGQVLPPLHGCPLYQWRPLAVCMKENFISKFFDRSSSILDLGAFCRADLTCITDNSGGCDWYRELAMTFIDIFCPSRPMCDVYSSLTCLETYETNYLDPSHCTPDDVSDDDSDDTSSDSKDDNSSDKSKDSKKSDDKSKMDDDKSKKDDDKSAKDDDKSKKDDDDKSKKDDDKSKKDDDKSKKGDDKSKKDDDKSKKDDDKSKKDDNKSKKGDDKSKKGDDKSKKGDDKSKKGDDKSTKGDGKSEKSKKSDENDQKTNEKTKESDDEDSRSEPSEWECEACKLYSRGKICVYVEVEQCSRPLRDWVRGRFRAIAKNDVILKCNDPCSPNPCQNGGSCSHRWNSDENKMDFTCSCPVGYGGEKCEQVTCRPDLTVTCVYKELTNLFEMDFYNGLCQLTSKTLACNVHVQHCDYDTWWHWNKTLNVFIREIEAVCTEPADRRCPISILTRLLDCADDMFNPSLIKPNGPGRQLLDVSGFCSTGARCLRTMDDCNLVRRLFLMFFDLVCPREKCRIKYSLDCIWKFEDGTGYGPEECRTMDITSRSRDKIKSPARPCTNRDNDEDKCDEDELTCKADTEKSDDKEKSPPKHDGLFHFDFDRYLSDKHNKTEKSCLWGWMNSDCYAPNEDGSEEYKSDESHTRPWTMFGKVKSNWGWSPFWLKDKSSKSEDDSTDDDLTCRWFNRTNICVIESTRECTPIWLDWIMETFKETNQSVQELCKNPCLPNPCLNGGSCEADGTDDFVCSCTKGWQGKTCEERTCNIAEAKVCVYNFVAGLVNATTSSGINLDSVCGQLNATLRCIDVRIVHCSADDQLYFTGFKEIVLSKVQTYCNNKTSCSNDDLTMLGSCVTSSGLKKVLDASVGMKSLCWANLNCFLTMKSDCWQITLIKDILIFGCDIKNIHCDVKHSLECIASYAAQVKWQLDEDLSSSIINGGLLPKIDPDHLPKIPGIGYDFCLSVNVSINCVDDYTVGCNSTWGNFLKRRVTNITKAASIDAVCKDPCAKHPCKHGYCEKKGFAPKCHCYPGYKGEFCDEEINKCDIVSFKACIRNVTVVVQNTGSSTCAEIEASLSCLGIHSLTCENFFGKANMASYIFLLSKAKLMKCNITEPELPIVELDECVANATVNCTRIAVTTFINETKQLAYDNGSSIIKYEFTTSCREFKEAVKCVNNISVRCSGSSDEALRTVNITKTSLSVAVDLKCSSCQASEAQACITKMETAINNGGFCQIDNYTDILLDTSALKLPPCSDICAFIGITEKCVTKSLTSCQNDTKASLVTEWRSVKAKLSDQCMSTCWPNPCLLGGTCNVINDTDYFCTCTAEDRLGQRCEIASECMYNFGPNYGDKETHVDLEKKINIGQDIQLHDGIYDSFYISVNGYVSFSGKPKFTSFMTFPTSGMTLLAPFFAEQDLSCGGRIFYQVYKRSSKNGDHESAVLDRASDDVRNATSNQHDTFSAQVVIVVTWYNVMEAPCSEHSEHNTYQLRIVSSRYKSFVFYSYHRLTGESERAFVGWATESGTSMVNELNGDDLEHHEDLKQKNNSIPGCWFWSFLPVVKPPEPEPADKCLTWVKSTIDLTQLRLPSCPCNYRLVTSDQRFRHAARKGGQFYANSTRIYNVTHNGKKYEYQQVCSYNRNGSLHTSRPFGAYATVVNDADDYSDQEAFGLCCRMSTRHCDAFFSVRPIGNCFSYKSPLIALLWGDPHIITIDQHRYTFNGIGDYVLLRIGPANNAEFELQGRMEPVVGGNATIYTGFAVSVRDGLKYAIVFDRQTNDLRLIVNDDEKLPLAKNSYKYNVFWLDRSSLLIDFSQYSNIGIESLSIRARAGMLSMIPQFNNRLLNSYPLGLMGSTSNNVFTAANGQRIPTTDPDCDIYSRFGQTWRISHGSLFPGKISTEGQGWCGQPCDHNTKFTEEELQMSCGDSESCRFDACATGDLAIANVTRDIESDFKNKTSLLENSPPQIFGETRLLAKVGEEISLTLTVIDKEKDAWMIYTADSYNVNNARFDNKTATFAWTPTDLNPVDISFVAVDSRGAYSSVFQVQVVLCSGCSGNGQCNYDIASESEQPPNFELAGCECSSGWEGNDCAFDEDGCRNNPCGVGGLCTDVPADGVVTQGDYICISCGAGLVLKGTQCKVLVPVIPERAITDIKNNKIGLVTYLENLPWSDDYLNIKTQESTRLINLLEPVLNHMYRGVDSHFHTTIRRFYRGSLAVEQEIQLTELSYEDVVDIALQLKRSTADGVMITGVLYPVKATYIITPDGNEVEISNDCQFYDSLGLCQNGGFCVMKDLTPECKCLSDNVNAFCEDTSSRRTDLKLIIPLSVMSALFLLGIVIIAVWGARKAKMAKIPPPYESEKDTAQLEAEFSASQSDLSLGKQHARRYHSWWPGQQPHAGSHA